MARAKVDSLMGRFSNTGAVVFVILNHVHLILSDENIVTNTKYGKLQGTRRQFNFGLHDGVTDYVDEYIGVPFAAPPVGKLRWQPPEEVKPWTDVRDAHSFGPACPQPKRSDLELCRFKYQDEDCLYLNIYSPYQSSDPYKRYPVMLYIHGGSYARGTGNRYNGTALAQYGTVVVSINYRLFALGFMTTGDDDMPGNYGFLDQIHALKWTKDNIDYFRGDPESVTVFGNSAGASSVGLLMLSPLAKGLFHRVIAHSGSPNAEYSVHWKTPEELKSQVLQLARGFNCDGKTTQEKIKCMKQVNWEMFTWETVSKIITCYSLDPPFKPLAHSKALPGSIRELAKGQALHDVPYMQGLVRDEYGYLGTDNQNFITKLIRGVYRDNKSVLKTAIFYYVDWQNTNVTYDDENWETVKYDSAQLVSDSVMVAPVSEMVQWLALRGDRQVYFYVFDNDTIYHSVDLNYVFGVPFTMRDVDEFGFCNGNCYYSKEDKDFSRFMMKMWVGFANEGKPYVKMDHWNSSIDWTQPNPYTLDYLYLSKRKTEMRQNFKTENVALWNHLIPDLYDSNSTVTNTLPDIDLPDIDDRIWIFLACAVVVLLFIFCFIIYLTAKKCQSNINPRATALS